MTQFFQFVPKASANNGGTLTGPGTTQSLPGAKTALGAWTFQETLTITKNSQAGTAETYLSITDSGDAVSKVQMLNATATDNTFVPRWFVVGASTNTVLTQTLQGTTDSGSNPICLHDFRIGSSSAVVNRNLQDWRNNNTTILSLIPLNSGANAALSWGTQAVNPPAFATRTRGIRQILFDAIGASAADYAIGMESGGPWIGTSQAIPGNQITLYAGITKLVAFRGDGLVDGTGMIRTSGNTTPTSGFGAYMYYTSGSNTAKFGGYNWNTSFPTITQIEGSSILLQVSGTTAFTSTATNNTNAVPNVLMSCTLGTVPSAAANTRGLVYITDLAGGPEPCFSDGTNWRVGSTRAIAA